MFKYFSFSIVCVKSLPYFLRNYSLVVEEYLFNNTVHSVSSIVPILTSLIVELNTNARSLRTTKVSTRDTQHILYTRHRKSNILHNFTDRLCFSCCRIHFRSNIKIFIKIMYHSNLLKNYKLSHYTQEKLNIIKDKLKEDILNSDPLWQIVIGKEGKGEREEDEEEDISQEISIDKMEIVNETNVDNDGLSETLNQFPSTQFYFTQVDISVDKETKQESIQKSDISECLLEGLEQPNGKLDLNQLENLTDEELSEVVCDLEKKLSMLGTYNLCCSLNNMTLEEQIKYMTVFHSHLLLPKIIALEEPSRLLVSVITECVKKFPNDIEKLIFIPLLNVDLKDTTIVNAITNAFEPERNITLIMEYLSHVKELKTWHLPVLQKLISTKTDTTTNDKLIQLLSKKSFDFAKNKDFGKLILSFIKLNVNFTEQQKQLLLEIANINQTLFKKPIQNLLNAM